MNRIARPGIMREIDVRGPTVTTDTSAVARLEPGRVTAATVAALRTGAVLARAEAGVVALTGPGAVTCFQGLLTNDIEKPGDGAFVYGALLTPKGMIVVDGWATRHGTTVSYTVPAHGRERALEILTRSVPPRLARLADRTAELAVLRLMGPRAQAVAEEAGLEVPSMVGRAVQSVTGDAGADVARPGDAAPFALQISLPADRAHAVRERLVAGGAVWADADALEFARILAGWPALGAEVDDKTIPPEVRYDELGGGSYTKGCYPRQETLSRPRYGRFVVRARAGFFVIGAGCFIILDESIIMCFAVSAIICLDVSDIIIIWCEVSCIVVLLLPLCPPLVQAASATTARTVARRFIGAPH